MFKWNYGRFMPFYAPDSGADGGAGDGDNRLTTGAEIKTAADVDTTDYKAECARLEKEYKKLKGYYDDVSSELSAKKKAEKARMTDDEKREAENAEKEQRYKELQNEVYEMRVSTAFAKAGFDEKEYDDIAKKIVEVGGEQSNDLAETLIAFVKKANQSAVASARNGAIKDGAVPPKTSTAQASKTPYATMIADGNQPNNREQEIKDFYKKK